MRQGPLYRSPKSGEHHVVPRSTQIFCFSLGACSIAATQPREYSNPVRVNTDDIHQLKIPRWKFEIWKHRAQDIVHVYARQEYHCQGRSRLRSKEICFRSNVNDSFTLLGLLLREFALHCHLVDDAYLCFDLIHILDLNT